MIPRKIEHLTPFVVLGAAVFIWLLLPPLVKRQAGNGFYEFQAPLWKGVSVVHDLQTYWSLRSRSKQNLIEGGQELARLYAGQQIRLQRLEELHQQNLRLRRLLDIPADPLFRPELARVVRRDHNLWWHQVIIRKGEDYGITPGAGVIFSGGVVGRVREVRRRTSVVDLISSPGFQMAARFEGDRRPIRFQGGLHRGLSRPAATIYDVPADIALPSEGSLVIEAHPLGGVFPAGMTLGTVESLEPGPDGLFQTGIVTLSPDLLTLEEVTVLIPISQD